jgi:pimeloyl-ACP methyl ester carboxylesterase
VSRAGSVEGRHLPPGGLAWEEHGSGPPVLLVHGPAIGRGLWRETVAALRGGFRVIAYDRRAYGASGAPEPYGGTTVEEQAEDAAALLGELRATPALLCGHDLGALVCLDLLRRHPAAAAGAVLVEPPVLSLSTRGSEEVARLRERLEGGAREGGAAGAVSAYLDEVAGPGAERRLGPERVNAARAAGRAFAADLAATPAWQFSRRELRAVSAPVTVVLGSHGHGVRVEVARALASMLGQARLVEADAGHLVPVEAPDTVAEAIRGVAEAARVSA